MSTASGSVKFYNSPAGYFGALAAIVLSILVAMKIIAINLPSSYIMFIIVGLVFIVMSVVEFLYLSRHHLDPLSSFAFSLSFGNRLKSTLYRFVALFIPILIFYAATHSLGYYASSKLFKPALEFFEILVAIYAVLGIPYIYITLSYRGAAKYEYGDYAILTILMFKSIYKLSTSENKVVMAKYKTILANRRISKVMLVYIVNFFFSTLMCRFVVTEFEALRLAFDHLFSAAYHSYTYSNKLYTWHQIIFNSIFLVDVSIAIVGYTVASRWLQNRTKSVDGTMFGWWVAIACYPPFNTMISSIFFGGANVHSLDLSDAVLTFIVYASLAMYMLYVWGTVALGFRFSNLTNRGIVSSGPYRFVRHPAYISKNISWWLEAPAAFFSPLAAVSMIFWNIIYTLRAITEERHLSQDVNYESYKTLTKYKFIPGIY